MVCMSATAELEQVGEIKRRCITLADGRYLIFYTFERPPDAAASHEKAQAESKPETVSAEERHV